MQDPIQRHPTRAEQLDILTDILASSVPADGRVLDLGCGTGPDHVGDELQVRSAGERRDGGAHDLASAPAALSRSSAAPISDRRTGWCWSRWRTATCSWA